MYFLTVKLTSEVVISILQIDKIVSLLVNHFHAVLFQLIIHTSLYVDTQMI